MSQIWQINKLFWGENLFFLLYIVGVLIVVFERKQDKRKRKILIVYTFFVYILLICNPLFLKISFKIFFSLNEEYVRVFYLLPIFATIAYAFVLLIYKTKKKAYRLGLLLILSVTIGIIGENFISQKFYTKPENIYKISNNALNISNMIIEDSDGDADAIIRKMDSTWDNLYWGIRQYTGKIRLNSEIINGEDYDREYYAVFDEYWEGIEETVTFNYVIIDKNDGMEKRLEEKNFSFVGESGEYVVYKRNG